MSRVGTLLALTGLALVACQTTPVPTPPSTPPYTSPAPSPTMPTKQELGMGLAGTLHSSRRTTGDADAIPRFALEIQSRVGQLVRELGEDAYPLLAREGRWEGTSHVRVEFGVGGVVKNIRVNNSSGYPLLDLRAIQLVQAVMPTIPETPTVPEELRDRDFAITFPIIFKLRVKPVDLSGDWGQRIRRHQADNEYSQTIRFSLLSVSHL